MPTAAFRLIRKMRGNAQAHLLEATDGCFYVVKFAINPKRRRILINEWIASAALKFLGILSPATETIEFSAGFLTANPDLYIQDGSRRLQPQPGRHFGSRFPGDPAKTSVYDYFPDALIGKIENLRDFAGTLAFDQWMGNTAVRHAVFFRGRIEDWRGGVGTYTSSCGYLAEMIGNASVFGGEAWGFTVSPFKGRYLSSAVYRNVRGLSDFEPWLSRIVDFPAVIFEQAVAVIPKEWLEGEEEALALLLAQAACRRAHAPNLLEAVLTEWNSAFDKPVSLEQLRVR